MIRRVAALGQCLARLYLALFYIYDHPSNSYKKRTKANRIRIYRACTGGVLSSDERMNRACTGMIRSSDKSKGKIINQRQKAKGENHWIAANITPR